MDLLNTQLETAQNSQTLVKKIQLSNKKREHFIKRNYKKTDWKDRIQYSTVCYQDSNDKNIVHGLINISATGETIFLEKARDINFKIVLKGNETSIYYEASKILLNQVTVEFIFKTIENAILELAKKAISESKKTENNHKTTGTSKEESEEESKKNTQYSTSKWKGYYFYKQPMDDSGRKRFKEAIADGILSQQMFSVCKKNNFNLRKFPKDLQ